MVNLLTAYFKLSEGNDRKRFFSYQCLKIVIQH